MDNQRNILAILLVGIIIMLTPYYLTLFEPVDNDSVNNEPVNNPYNFSSEDTLSQFKKDVSFSVDDKHIKTSKKKTLHIDTPLYFASISNQFGGSIYYYKLKLFDGGFNSLENYQSNINSILIDDDLTMCRPCLNVFHGQTGKSFPIDVFFNSNYIDNDTLFISPNSRDSLFFDVITNDFTMEKTIVFSGDSLYVSISNIYSISSYFFGGNYIFL